MSIQSNLQPTTSSNTSMNKKHNKTIIDLGTGDGRFVFKSAQANPNNLYIGIDPSEKQLQAYSKKINTNRLENLRPESMHWTHQVGNWFLTTVCDIIYPEFPFKDSQSGMWIFKRKIWSKLNVRSSGMPFSQELKIEAYRKGFRCKEVPIDYRARIGEVKLRGLHDAIGNTVELFKKRLVK